MDEKFKKKNNPISLTPVMEVKGSEVESEGSGGTAAILPAERAKKTFDVEKMIHIFDGGAERTKRRRFIVGASEGIPLADKHGATRDAQMAEHIEHFIKVHEDFAGKIKPTREEISWMSEYAMSSGTMMNNYGLFVGTLNSQATDEQQLRWLLPTVMFKMVGCYAQ